MSFSTPQVESRIQFSPLPQDVQHDIEVNGRHIVLESSEERIGAEALVLMLRLALVVTLFLGLAVQPMQKPTFDDPIPPKFFLNSLHVPHLKVSDGEVSSTWDMTLNISNIMNNSNINILKLEAKVCYEENKTLAVITPITPQNILQNEAFILNEKETKMARMKLSTTGWEENQPIVDDIVVQAITHDVPRGVTRFSLHMSVLGEVWLGDGLVETFTMYPKCSNLEVKFVGVDQQGETATMIDSNPRECIGLVEWGPMRDSRYI